jgi:hypothetical protein
LHASFLRRLHSAPTLKVKIENEKKVWIREEMDYIKKQEEMIKRVKRDIDKMRDERDEWEINIIVEILRDKTLELKESIIMHNERMNDIDPKNMDNDKEEGLVNRLEVLYSELAENLKDNTDDSFIVEGDSEMMHTIEEALQVIEVYDAYHYILLLGEDIMESEEYRDYKVEGIEKKRMMMKIVNGKSGLTVEKLRDLEARFLKDIEEYMCKDEWCDEKRREILRDSGLEPEMLMSEYKPNGSGKAITRSMFIDTLEE